MRLQLQIFVLASVIAAAHGMCFGAPSLQQSVVCPATMVYYPQLCICIEPKRKPRLYDSIGYMREAPNMLVREAAYPVHPEQAYQQRLTALRQRLTASLPDTSLSSYSNSALNTPVATPSLLRPDRFHRPNHLQSVGLEDAASIINQVPRSWKIGGLYEYWRRRNAERRGLPPRLMFKRMPISGLRQSGRGNSLPLRDRLKQMRAAWQRAAIAQARNRFGNEALARRFLEKLPTRGISPDASRVQSQTPRDAAPDSPRGDLHPKSSKKQRKMPLLALKEAALLKQGFRNMLPLRTPK